MQDRLFFIKKMLDCQPVGAVANRLSNNSPGWQFVVVADRLGGKMLPTGYFRCGCQPVLIGFSRALRANDGYLLPYGRRPFKFFALCAQLCYILKTILGAQAN